MLWEVIINMQKEYFLIVKKRNIGLVLHVNCNRSTFKLVKQWNVQ